MPTYQPPAFLQPQQYQGISQLPQTFDQVMQRAAQMRQVQAQLDAQQQQMGSARLQTAPFGFAPEQVTPQAIQEASSGLAQDRFKPFNPTATPMASQNTAQSMSDQGAPQLSPLAQGIQKYIQMQQASAALGIRKTESDISNVGATASKSSEEARRMRIGTNLLDPTMQGGGPSIIDSALNKVRRGEWTPSQGDDWGNKNPDFQLAYQAGAARSNIPFASLQRQANAKQAGMNSEATLTEGGQAQQLARAGQAALGQLDILQESSNNFARYNKQFANMPYINLVKQGGKDVLPFLIAVHSARTEYAAVLARGGKPGLEEMAAAEKAIPDSVTPTQLPGVIKQLKINVGETVKGQMTPATLSGAEKSLNEARSGVTKWSGGNTHTYEDGTVAKWNGKAWVRQQ